MEKWQKGDVSNLTPSASSTEVAVKNADLGKGWQNRGQVWLVLQSSTWSLAVMALSHRLTHVGINRMCYISSSVS